MLFLVMWGIVSGLIYLAYRLGPIYLSLLLGLLYLIFLILALPSHPSNNVLYSDLTQLIYIERT